MLKEKPWYKKWWAITLFIFLGIGLIGALGDSSNDLETNIENTEANQVETVAVFDMEALYGKNVDEIKQILGEPVSDTEPRDLQINATSEDQLAKEWDKTWEKDGWELSAFYNVENREIIDFFISTNDPSGATKDIKKLEAVVGAKNLSNFIVEPVKVIRDPSMYTGIKITPKK